MTSRRTIVRTFATASAGALLGAFDADAQSTDAFRHGVASGDPLPDRVIIWTRVSPAGFEQFIPVDWYVAEDAGFSTVVQRGVTSAHMDNDYTVKLDVTRLKPNTVYYYRFVARSTASPVGRTKTLPLGQVDRVRFAVASCSNFPYGFFNVYQAIARRTDLDCVLHLGDYIYEYENGVYGNGAEYGRIPSPNREITTLTDYRMRYAQYRQDPDLQEAHRVHPWMIVWDDHETTDNSWRDGALNHQPAAEGSWATRRAAAIQAWFEWQPVRENPFQDSQIYRTFRFGNLADLVMLDTRLAGRDQQVAETSPAIADPNRSLLGADQEEWFFSQLSRSKARNTRWRIVGQQVMMGQLLAATGAPFNADQWDGYLTSRNRFLGHLSTNSINNVVVLTGDIHSSWANEIAVNPFSPSANTRLAVEFVVPAVSSPGVDDRAVATATQQGILATHPHVKYVELFRRGYMVIDLDKDRAQSQWYHIRTITTRSADEELAKTFRVASGEAKLV